MSGSGNNTTETLTLSEAMKKIADENIFTTILTNPQKRAKVLELLTKEGIVGRDENLSHSSRSNKYNSPIKRLQKNENVLNSTPKSKPIAVRMESPSALGRRRALQRLESDSSAEEPPQKPTSPTFVGSPKPIEHLLEGVVAYCEIRSNGEDRSAAIKTMMKTMGARIKDNLCTSVTHVILKDGLYTTYRKAKLMKCHVVSVLWLEAVRRYKFLVPESKFPAVCADAYEADLTKICQNMQKDYDDVIRDEFNKTTEIDRRQSTSTTNKYVTNRKKSVKSRSTVYGFDCSGFKDAHNRTEIASPYKYKCNDPELSESDSSISVGCTPRKSLEIIPCSQDHHTSLSIYHHTTPQLTKVDEEDPEEVLPETNLAKRIKDSFELTSASKIRSPESLLNQSKQKNSTKRNTESLENDSLKLHISTTDESYLNSTGNKSKSINTNSFKNQLGDISPITTKLTSDSSRKMSSDDVNFNLHISEDSQSNSIKSKENNVDTLPNNNLENNEEISRPGSSISTTGSDVDINKNKTRRRTSVGLKRPAKNVSNDVSTKTPTKIQKTPKIKAIACSIEKNDDTVHGKKQNEVKRNTRRQSVYQTNTEVEENQPKKSNRKTLGKVNTENKTKFAEINEEIAETVKENNLDDVRQSSIRKSRRKTLGKVNTENKTKPAEICEEIDERAEENNLEDNNQRSIRNSREKTIANTNKENEVTKLDEDKNNNATSSDSSADKTKRRVRKLYNPNQSISASQINWDDEPDPDPKISSVSPPKKRKCEVPIKELPKFISVKAQKKIKSTIKNTPKSKTTETTKSVNSDNKNKRKSVRALNFNSTSSETSDSEVKSNPVVQTPSRRSVRIANTPAKTVKIIETESDSESESNTNKSSDSSVIKRTITPRTRKTRFISSQETESSSSQRTPKTQPKKKKHSQLLNEESKRRSTLDFVPQHSEKSLEQIRQSQKPKPPPKLRSIVCTRLHKSDVQVFQQIVKKLGGFVVQDEVTKWTTHLVAGDPGRTVNLLRAIARGIWVVKKEWLYKSLEAGKWLEEEDYELTEFSPAVQKCRVMKQSFGRLFSMDLFITCGPIYISRGSTPRFSDLEELVELCGGRFTRNLKDAPIIVGEYANHENAICVSEKWILDSITKNRMMKCKVYLLERPKSPEM